MFLLTINNNSKNKDITHLTTKMVVLNNPIENTLQNVANLSSCVKLDMFYIISIVMCDKLQYEIKEVISPCNVKYIEVGLKFFVENYLENPGNHNFWQFNKNTLYILRDGNYSDVKELFTTVQNMKANIVRGSSQKSHMVSPIDFRLSCYLMILFDMDYKRFSSENSFNILTKDRYLPSYK